MMNRRLRLFSLIHLAISGATLNGCREQDIASPVLTRIEVAADASIIDLDAAGTLQLAASGHDQFNNPIALDTVIWSSSNPSVATVDQNGLVTGVTRGTVNIKVASGKVSGFKILTLIKAKTLEEIRSGIQALADARSGFGKLPGVSISVILGDGNQIDVVSGISKTGILVSPDMRFGLASITKTAIAATVLRLEEEGLLSIQSPISNYVNLNLANVDNSITLFQLLNHLAGLQDYFNHPDLWPAVENNLDQPIQPLQLAGYIGPPVFSPGARFEYSNSNYVVLGLVIEAITGKKVSQVMREKLWEPLNLPGIYLGSEELPTGDVAAPWRDQDGDLVLEDISADFRAAYHSVFYTAADIFSTAHDLANWTKELYDEQGNALSGSSRKKMLTFYDVSGQPDWTGYGLGVRRWTIGGRILWGHSGGMRGYTTNMFWDPSRKQVIVILTNQSLAPNGGFMIREILLGIFGLIENR